MLLPFKQFVRQFVQLAIPIRSGQTITPNTIPLSQQNQPITQSMSKLYMTTKLTNYPLNLKSFPNTIPYDNPNTIPL